MLKKIASLFQTKTAPDAGDLSVDTELRIPVCDDFGNVWTRLTVSDAGGSPAQPTIRVASADALPLDADINLATANVMFARNAAGTWDRIRTAPDNADAQASLAAGPLLALSRLQGFNEFSWDRIRALPDDTDGQAPNGRGALLALARVQGWSGTGFERMRVASATTQGNFDAHTGITAVAMAGNWSITSDPAAAAQATVTRAAAIGYRHICTSLHASLSAGAGASGILKVYLRDGAAGVGAILWSANIQVPAAQFNKIDLTGLSITGTTGAAMTLEFSAAGGAGSQENVSLTGYSVL